MACIDEMRSGGVPRRRGRKESPDRAAGALVQGTPRDARSGDRVREGLGLILSAPLGEPPTHGHRAGEVIA